MVIQTRISDGGAPVLRCFAQHDHAILSGELAAAWVGPGDDARDYMTVLAIGMHDIGWREADGVPRLDPATARPYDFVALPLADRVAVYGDGIDALEHLHPYAGLLGSLHLSAFVDPSAAPDFARREADRRERLTTTLGAPPEQVARGLELLKALDRLSLIACLTPPGAVPSAVPPWLGDSIRVDGRAYHVAWDSESRVTLDPFPLRSPLSVTIPFRDLAGAAWSSQEELTRAWDVAEQGRWEITFGRA